MLLQDEKLYKQIPLANNYARYETRAKGAFEGRRGDVAGA